MTRYNEFLATLTEKQADEHHFRMWRAHSQRGTYHLERARELRNYRNYRDARGQVEYSSSFPALPIPG